MKCKMLACDIIDLIFDMETNVRVTKATQIFKKLLNELTPLKKGQKFLNKSPTVPTHKDKGNTF